MSDLPARPAKSRGLRYALAISVALNLAVVGVVGGAMLRADGPRGHAMPRDLGFGMFTEALTRENRADLRQRLKSAAPEFSQQRQAMAQDLVAIVAALHADPFDRTALDRAMQLPLERLRARLDLGHALLLDFLSDLPASDRKLFADRLEASAARRPPMRGPDTRD